MLSFIPRRGDLKWELTWPRLLKYLLVGVMDRDGRYHRGEKSSHKHKMRMTSAICTVRNPLLLCPLVLAQDGGTRSWQKCLHRDFSATVLNFSTKMHQSVGNGMREFCDMSKFTITIVDANDLTSRESQC